MTTYKLGLPSEVRRRLEYSLPRQRGSRPMVTITPRGRDERRCPAYAADHYEVNVFYAASDLAALDPLEEALKAEPGVYLTTRVHADSAQPWFSNPGWPPALGSKRRDRNQLRVQVIALMSDPAAESGT